MTKASTVILAMLIVGSAMTIDSAVMSARLFKRQIGMAGSNDYVAGSNKRQFDDYFVQIDSTNPVIKELANTVLNKLTPPSPFFFVKLVETKINLHTGNDYQMNLIFKDEPDGTMFDCNISFIYYQLTDSVDTPAMACSPFQTNKVWF